MDPSDWNLNARNWVLLTALILAALAALLPGSTAMRNRELSFDGGFNAQVAKTLAEKHRYATTYRGLHDFDHRVQTGPTVIVPAAAVFRLLGVNNTTAQLTNLVYLTGMFLLAVLLCWQLSGPLTAYLVIPVLLATPHLFQLGMGLYGEIPALFFLLAALLFLHRWFSHPAAWAASATGVCLGLAVLTKFQMLLPIAVLATFVLILALRRRVPHWRHHAVAASAFVAVLLPIEAIKLHVLGIASYLQWWRAMLGRSFAQATSYRIHNTVSGAGKSWFHLGILARQLHLPGILTIALLFLPPILMTLLVLRGGRENAEDRERTRDLILIALAVTGLSLTLWWLFLSPTSRAWLRRIIDGVILLEILGTIVVVEQVRRLCRSDPAPTRDRRRTTLPRWTVPAAVILLAQALSVLTWTQIPTVDRRVRPTAERFATGAMIAAINGLPEEATIYAKGWYEAPVLAAMTGRAFLDLDQFPIDRYRTPLRQTYFIADAAMARNRPDEIDDVLSRAGTIFVERAGKHTLYKLDILCPYAPIPRPPTVDCLLSLFRPASGSYPYASGVGREGTPGQAHNVCGILLARRDLPCLVVDIDLLKRAGHNPVVMIHLDDTEIWRERTEGEERYRRVIPLPPQAGGADEPSLVEITLYRDGGQPPYYLLDRDWGLYTIRAVGFTADCDTGVAGDGTPQHDTKR